MRTGMYFSFSFAFPENHSPHYFPPFLFLALRNKNHNFNTNKVDFQKLSLQFNIVSKHLGAERMNFFINEAANDIRDMLLPSLVTDSSPEKAKL